MIREALQRLLSSWQVLTLAALLVVSYSSILTDVSLPTYFRRIRLHWVLFFSFIGAANAFIAFLSVAFHTGFTPQILIVSSLASTLIALVLMIWFKPSVNELSLIDDEDTGSESASREVGSERITHKLAYSIVVLIVPAILVAHVHKNRQLYLNDVSKFERITDGRTDTGENRFGQYGSAIRLYSFFSVARLTVLKLIRIAQTLNTG